MINSQIINKLNHFINNSCNLSKITYVFCMYVICMLGLVCVCGSVY